MWKGSNDMFACARPIREAIELCLEVEGAPDQDLEFVGTAGPAAPRTRRTGARERSSPAGSLKVGVAWAGSPGHQNDRKRCGRRRQGAPLFGIQFAGVR